MKATELMTGDLCRVNRDNLCIKKGTIVEIRSIDADDRLNEKGLVGSAHCHPLDENQFDGGIWCDYLDPIPITPEILEKNGFKQYGDTGWWLEDDYYDINMYEWSDSIWVFEYECNEMSAPNTKVVFSYVHELQHALRMCGVEETIEL